MNNFIDVLGPIDLLKKIGFPIENIDIEQIVSIQIHSGGASSVSIHYLGQHSELYLIEDKHFKFLGGSQNTERKEGTKYAKSNPQRKQKENTFCPEEDIGKIRVVIGPG